MRNDRYHFVPLSTGSWNTMAKFRAVACHSLLGWTSGYVWLAEKASLWVALNSSVHPEQWRWVEFFFMIDLNLSSGNSFSKEKGRKEGREGGTERERESKTKHNFYSSKTPFKEAKKQKSSCFGEWAAGLFVASLFYSPLVWERKSNLVSKTIVTDNAPATLPFPVDHSGRFR